MAARKKKPTINYADIEELAAQGLTNKDIAAAQGWCDKTFYNYLERDTQFTLSLKRGKQKFRDTIREATLQKAVVERDTTMLIFLNKQLGIFKQDKPNIPLKDTKQALQAYEILINSDIPDEQKTALKMIVDSFIRGVEITEIEQRLKHIEGRINELDGKSDYY